MQKKNIAEVFKRFDDTWSPKVVADVNDMQVKVAKLSGPFEWHSHEQEDELFWVISGQLRMELRNQDPITIDSGEFLVIPHGVEHRPIADTLCEVVLFEPRSTINTGNVTNSLTIRDLERL